VGKFLYLMTFIGSLNPQFEAASDASRRALLETQMMKDEIKDLEIKADKTLNEIGVDRDDFIYVVYAYPLFAGKFSTKPIKTFKYTTNDLTFRPELEYTFKDHSYSTFLIMSKDF
jgi:hypothetical protein